MANIESPFHQFYDFLRNSLHIRPDWNYLFKTAHDFDDLVTMKPIR